MGKIDFPFLIVAKIRILFNNGKKKEFFLVYSLPFTVYRLILVYSLPFTVYRLILVYRLLFTVCFGLLFTVYRFERQVSSIMKSEGR